MPSNEKQKIFVGISASITNLQSLLLASDIDSFLLLNSLDFQPCLSLRPWQQQLISKKCCKAELFGDAAFGLIDCGLNLRPSAS